MDGSLYLNRICGGARGTDGRLCVCHGFLGASNRAQHAVDAGFLWIATIGRRPCDHWFALAVSAWVVGDALADGHARVLDHVALFGMGFSRCGVELEHLAAQPHRSNRLIQ